MPMLGVNVGTIQDYVDMGRLNPDKQPLTLKDLVDAGITKVNAIEYGIKLLAGGKERLKTPVVLEVSRASEAAIQAMEAVGGEVTTVHYNKLALRALLRPHKFDILPKQARPPPKLLTYYRSYKNRGYLSPQIQIKKLIKARPELEHASNGTASKEQADIVYKEATSRETTTTSTDK
jgi:large subunit ribosomal protein L15